MHGRTIFIEDIAQAAKAQLEAKAEPAATPLAAVREGRERQRCRHDQESRDVDLRLPRTTDVQPWSSATSLM